MHGGGHPRISKYTLRVLSLMDRNSKPKSLDIKINCEHLNTLYRLDFKSKSGLSIQSRSFYHWCAHQYILRNPFLDTLEFRIVNPNLENESKKWPKTYLWFLGGLSVPMRSLKRSNSETDLISIIPEQTKQHHLTKQLSSALIPITRLRKSIRRRSMQKEKLTTISEMDCHQNGHQNVSTKKRLTKFNSNQEVSDSPKMQPAKKSIRRSLQMKSPSAKVVHEVCPITSVTTTSNRRITRSNAFRFGSKQNRSETSFNLSSLDHSDVSLLDQSICSIATTAACSGTENGVAKRFTTRSTIEKRKKIRSIATFNLSFAI